jgi:hypothetical protein
MPVPVIVRRVLIVNASSSLPPKRNTASKLKAGIQMMGAVVDFAFSA